MSNQTEKANLAFVTPVVLKNAGTGPPALQPQRERAEAQTPSHRNRIDLFFVLFVHKRAQVAVFV